MSHEQDPNAGSTPPPIPPQAAPQPSPQQPYPPGQYPYPPQKKGFPVWGWVLIILGVCFLIVMILAAISVPVYNSIIGKARTAKALSNARQVGTACKSYAGDNEGYFPSEVDENGEVIMENGKPRVPADSNTAFKTLIPDYIPMEELFYAEGSYFTPLPPDEYFEDDYDKLQSGENHWGYMAGNFDFDKRARLLLFSGAANVQKGQWSDEGEGSLGGGTNTIIVLTDLSAQNAKLSSDFTLARPNDVWFTPEPEGKMADFLTPLNPK